MRPVILSLSALLTITPIIGEASSGEAGGATKSSDTQLRNRLREKVNAGLVGIVLGTTSSDEKPTLFGLSDFFGSLEQEDAANRLRIFQIEGKGSSQNVLELGFARGIDAGIVQSDVLDAVKQKPPFPHIESYLQYVAKLYDKPIQILANGDIKSIQDLAGKKVNFGPKNSDNYFTASRIFERAGVNIQPVDSSSADGLEQLKAGNLAALVYVGSKPAELFNFPDEPKPAAAVADATAPPPLPKPHFLAVPGSEGSGYDETELTSSDYPQLIDQPVHTLSVGAILMVYNFQRTPDRYRKLTRFVKAVLDHTVVPAQRVNIAANIPGWTRFGPAETWMEKHNLDATPKHAEANEKLFSDFVQYYQQQAKIEAEGIAGSSGPTGRDRPILSRPSVSPARPSLPPAGIRQSPPASGSASAKLQPSRHATAPSQKPSHAAIPRRKSPPRPGCSDQYPAETPAPPCRTAPAESKSFQG
jgi:uncharacterized protein